jgi:hypothetical protein
MSVLQIILADLVAELGPKKPDAIQFPSPIRSTLQGLFDRIISSQAEAKPPFMFSSVNVSWWSLKLRGGSSAKPGPAASGPPLGALDLIVYFVRDTDDSVLQHLPGGSFSPGAGATGHTSFVGPLTASEVYTKGNQSDPVGLGLLAFHELMHFASHADNTTLHNMRSFGSKPTSLNAASITSSTPMTEGDINFMVKHLPNPIRTPWTGGYRAYTDPLNGHV